jgi:hypothetical protein
MQFNNKNTSLISSENVAVCEQRRVVSKPKIRLGETPDPEKDEAQRLYLYSNVAMLLSLHRAEFQHQRIHWIL